MKEQLSVLIDGGSFGTVYLRADCSVVKEVKKVSNRLIMSHNLLKEFPLKHTVVPQITWNPFLYSMPYVGKKEITSLSYLSFKNVNYLNGINFRGY